MTAGRTTKTAQHPDIGEPSHPAVEAVLRVMDQYNALRLSPGLGRREPREGHVCARRDRPMPRRRRCRRSRPGQAASTAAGAARWRTAAHHTHA